ncbi:MAG: class I SAM-dependent methyltransferase, partial [Nitrospiria bacterium]
MSKKDLEEQKEFYSEAYKNQPEGRKFNDLLFGIKEYYMSVLMPVTNRRMLCLGSGYGSKCRFFSKQGAIVFATDVVIEPLKKMRSRAQNDGLNTGSLFFIVADAHCLPFKTERFDIVYGMGVLHHLDNDGASKEIYRVMKNQGKGLFKEPFGLNPIIGLYRLVTP